MSITEDDVRHVAALASLELAPDEIARMQRDMSSILEHIEKLSQADTSGVDPMTQVRVASDESAADEIGISQLRPDERVASLDRASALKNAPVTDGVFFQVPKVIER